MLPLIDLSPLQHQVIDALSSGVSITAAAADAGIHRNTIANWRRQNPLFAEVLSSAQYDRALLMRERAESLVDLAFQTLQSILNDPAAPASVRLKAALHIITTASTQPAPEKRGESAEKLAVQEWLGDPHIDAQSIPDSELRPEPPSSTAPQFPSPVHKTAQTDLHKVAQIRRNGPKIGRNEPCPCGSGKKFKRCCVDLAA